jgi:hypothetical protein
MDFYLQYGWGMKAHCETLLKEWDGGHVILSPRDLEPEKLLEYSILFKSCNANILFDPQVYLPHSQHPRLMSHDYWDKNYDTINFFGGNLSRQLEKLAELNNKIGSSAFIIPGIQASLIEENWLNYQKCLIEASVSLDNSLDLIATVALGYSVIKDSEQVHLLLEAARGWQVKQVYLICEPPKNSYLVDEPAWIANVLELVAGFRLNGLSVILGYCSHQMLIASCASANAIASGIWQNTRSFSTAKFDPPSPSPSNRAVWYYCHQGLSEFKLATLELACMQGSLDKFRPSEDFSSSEAEILFQGSAPTATGFSERESFRHYLRSFRTQVIGVRNETFDSCLRFNRDRLDTAEQFLQEIHALGIKDVPRDFSQVIDASRGALAYLENMRGSLLRRKWNLLH